VNSSSKKRLHHAAETVVQSGMVYSCALFIAALVAVIPDNGNNSQVYALSSYATNLLVAITGIAPTIMIARVSLEAAHTINHVASNSSLSILQFQGHKSSSEEEV